MRNFIAIVIFSTVLFYGCSGSGVGKNVPSVHSNGITYFNDTATGLCFGKVESITDGMYSVVSITCVPCDSLKRIGLIK